MGSVLSLLGLLMLAVPAFAQLSVPAAQTSPSPSASPTATIGDTTEAATDARIARRIEGIFAAVPALAKVKVDVAQGVVTLSGKVSTAADIDRAEQIASRIAGVVTVENGVQRDLSVSENVQSLGGLSGKLAALVKLLPLIGAALIVGLVIAAIGYAIASLSWIWRRFAANSFLADLIASAVRFIFVTGGIVIALQMIGAGALLGAVLGGAGIVGIALGFAMRDTIENYVASIMLSVRQPFRANDLVQIDSYEGRVIRLTSRATILMTLDGNHLRIPNGTVFKAVILNYTRNPERRFDFDLGIDADSDPNTARHLGVETLAALDFILSDPPPAARVVDVGDSNIVIKFLGWIDQERTDWYKARSRAIPAVKAALEQAGFALPEPIYRLRFDAGASLPLGPATATAAPPPQPETAPASGIAAPDEHVTPDDHIAEMVDKERKAESGGEHDLLDSSRPVE